MYLSLADVARLEQDTASASSGLDMKELNRLIEERRGLAGEIGEAARSGYSSVQDPVSHFFSARKAGKTAELGAREKMIADEIALQQALLTSQSRSGGVGGLDFDFSAKESEALTLGDIQREKEDRERIDDAWSDFTKPKPGKTDFNFGEALYYFLQQTNGVFPSQYKTELRIFKNPVDGEDWSGALPEYYDLVIEASRNPENLDKNVDPRRAQEKYIQDQLNKWHSFQRE